MISLYSFNTLDENKQIEYVWDNGMFISSKIQGDYTINLHQVHSFYVELFYCQQANKVQQVVAFKTIDSLEEYLNVPELDMHVEIANRIIGVKMIQ